MDLFEVVNMRAFPSAHALLIEPFKTMWEEDISPGKEDSIKIFTYVELLCSPKKSNPFAGYSDEERPSKVKKEVWGDTPPTGGISQIINLVRKYKELLEIASPTYALFSSSMVAADKLKDFLNTINPDRRTASGTLVLKPRDITSALKEIPDTIRSLEMLRAKVNQELLEDSKTRNQREIGAYER